MTIWQDTKHTASFIGLGGFRVYDYSSLTSTIMRIPLIYLKSQISWTN